MLATFHARAWIPFADILCFAATSFVVDAPEKCIASSPSNDVPFIGLSGLAGCDGHHEMSDALSFAAAGVAAL